MSTLYYPFKNVSSDNNNNNLNLIQFKSAHHDQPRVHGSYNERHHIDNLHIDLSWTSIILIISLIIVSLWIFLLNLLVIVGLVKKSPTSKSSTDYYFINLSCIDVIHGMVILPFMGIVVIFEYFPLSYCWCQLWIFIDYILIIGPSIGFMGLLLNYVWMVRRPSEYKQSQGQHFLLILLTWFISIFIWVPAYINNYRINYPSGVCGFNININHYFTLYVGILGFYIPLIICLISICYSICILRRQIQDRLFYVSKLKPNNNSNLVKGKINTPLYLNRIWSSGVMFETNHIRKVQRQAKRELPLVGSLLVLFILSRIIYYVYFGIGAFVPSIFPNDLSNSVYWIIHIQGCLSPILHILMDKELRDSIITNVFNYSSRPSSSSLQLINSFNNSINNNNKNNEMLLKTKSGLAAITSTTQNLISPILLIKPVTNKKPMSSVLSVVDIA